jgi:hypothetical protein
MNRDSFFKHLQGTILEDILFVGPDDFIEPDSNRQKNEEIIGEMNDLEKAVFTVFSEKYESVKNSLGKNFDFSEDIDLTPKKIERTLSDLQLLREVKFFHDLFWMLLEKRLGEKLSKIENSGLGVRKGFLAVALSGKHRSVDSCLN